MKEYIERAAILENLGYEENRQGDVLPGSTFDIILKEPAADVAEVVRCRECKYRADRLYCRLRKTPYIVANLDFCSYGEPNKDC